LEAHKTKLSLKAADWKRKDEALAKEPEVTEGEPKDPWDFICIHSQASVDEEEDEEDEAAEEGDDGTGPNASEAIGKLASLYPRHKWISSLLGQDRSRWWMQESFKRDPDSFDMYIYNDFAWYGKIEVFENIVSSPALHLVPSACAGRPNVAVAAKVPTIQRFGEAQSFIQGAVARGGGNCSHL
jgi:hypothetical protein